MVRAESIQTPCPGAGKYCPRGAQIMLTGSVSLFKNPYERDSYSLCLMRGYAPSQNRAGPQFRNPIVEGYARSSEPHIDPLRPILGRFHDGVDDAVGAVAVFEGRKVRIALVPAPVAVV
jgi:hypothetical protein